MTALVSGTRGDPGTGSRGPARSRPGPDDLVRRGQELARSGYRAGAYAHFQAALDLDPRHETAWLWRAATAGDPAEAIRSLERLLRLNPAHAAARAGLAQLRAEAAAEAARLVPRAPAARPTVRTMLLGLLLAVCVGFASSPHHRAFQHAAAAAELAPAESPADLLPEAAEAVAAPDAAAWIAAEPTAGVAEEAAPELVGPETLSADAPPSEPDVVASLVLAVPATSQSAGPAAARDTWSAARLVPTLPRTAKFSAEPARAVSAAAGPLAAPRRLFQGDPAQYPGFSSAAARAWMGSSCGVASFAALVNAARPGRNMTVGEAVTILKDRKLISLKHGLRRRRDFTDIARTLDAAIGREGAAYAVKVRSPEALGAHFAGGGGPIMFSGPSRAVWGIPHVYVATGATADGVRIVDSSRSDVTFLSWKAWVAQTGRPAKGAGAALRVAGIPRS